MTTAKDVLDIARSQIGFKEGPNNDTKYGRWYGLNFQPYCAMGLSWAFHKAGLPLPAQTSKGFAYTPSGASWFKKQKRFYYAPAVGDVVFFYWPSMGRIAHVGIVEKIDADKKNMTTIEWNTNPNGSRNGDGCYRMRRSTKLQKFGGNIAGYGRPRYTVPVVKPAPAPVVKPTPAPIPSDGFKTDDYTRGAGGGVIIIGFDGYWYLNLGNNLYRLEHQQKYAGEFSVVKCTSQAQWDTFTQGLTVYPQE